MAHTVLTRRYSKFYLNEGNEAEEKYLESMINVLLKVSAKRLPLIDDKEFSLYTRVAAWIKTSQGENHLICTASMHIDGTQYHAEELLVRAIYALYQGDKQVLHPLRKQMQMHVHRMFLDLEPCDGERYSGRHDCARLFKQEGRVLHLAEKRINFSFDKGIAYWAVPLPPEGLASGARSNDPYADHYNLGISLNRSDEHIAHWHQCYVVGPGCINNDHTVKPERISLADYFDTSATPVPANPLTPQINSSTTSALPSISMDAAPPVISRLLFTTQAPSQPAIKTMPITHHSLTRKRSLPQDTHSSLKPKMHGQVIAGTMMFIQHTNDNDHLIKAFNDVGFRHSHALICSHYSASKKKGIFLCKSKALIPAIHNALAKFSCHEKDKLKKTIVPSVSIIIHDLDSENYHVLRQRCARESPAEFYDAHIYPDKKAVFTFASEEMAKRAINIFKDQCKSMDKQEQVQKKMRPSFS